MRSALTHPTPHVASTAVKARGPNRAINSGGRAAVLESPGLATRLRLRDGRIYDGTLPPERHRSLHLGLLHVDSDGYVELAAGRRPPGGKLRMTTRRDRGHFLPGGAGGPWWLEALLGLAARHHAAGDEICVAPAVRSERAAAKAHVHHTRWLWIDVDGRDGLPAVRQLVRRKPAHLVIESAVIRSDQLQRSWRRADPCWRHVASESEVMRRVAGDDRH